MDADETPASVPVQLPARTKLAYEQFAIIAGVIFSCGMLFLAMLNIMGGDGLMGYLKAALMATGAGVVAYAINRLAIERGAEQATKGYRGATALSIGSILLVGAGFFAATYPGVVLSNVESLSLTRHGTELAATVEEISRAAADGDRAGPGLRATGADLTAKRDCEEAESCVSGRGNGGRGPVWRALDSLAGRAQSIERQLAAGEETRRGNLAALAASIAEYQDMLADDGRSIWARRADLQTIDAHIRQQAASIGEALPLTLLAAYAEELRAGITIPGRPDATAAITAITGKHGEALATAVASIERASVSTPRFPKRAGVSEAFSYIGHFLPVAAIAFVIDLVFPITLWAYTYWSLSWNLFRQQAALAERKARLEEPGGTAVIAAETPASPVAKPAPPVAGPESAFDGRPRNDDDRHRGTRRERLQRKHRGNGRATPHHDGEAGS